MAFLSFLCPFRYFAWPVVLCHFRVFCCSVCVNSLILCVLLFFCNFRYFVCLVVLCHFSYFVCPVVFLLLSFSLLMVSCCFCHFRYFVPSFYTFLVIFIFHLVFRIFCYFVCVSSCSLSSPLFRVPGGSLSLPLFCVSRLLFIFFLYFGVFQSGFNGHLLSHVSWIFGQRFGLEVGGGGEKNIPNVIVSYTGGN